MLPAVFYEMRSASQAGSSGVAMKLSGKLLGLQQEAGQFSVPNDFGARLSQAGAVNLNASTSQDATQYTASLPSNMLELWFALEADRFKVGLFGHHGKTGSKMFITEGVVCTAHHIQRLPACCLVSRIACNLRRGQSYNLSLFFIHCNTRLE